MTIYFDMDGTLAEYRKEASLADYMTDGYYASLMPTELTQYANDLAQVPGLDIYVLSIYILPPAIEEKRNWLDIFCPNIDDNHRLILPAGTDKAAAIMDITGRDLGQQDVLIDDHTPNLLSWQSAGGRGIKWLNGVNGSRQRFQGERYGDVEALNQALCNRSTHLTKNVRRI